MAHGNGGDSIVTVNRESQQKLVSYIKAAGTIRDEGWQLRNRLENVDRQYMREADFTDETRKAKNANRSGDPTKLVNMQVPMIMESAENTVGFLTNVFLADYPIFKMGSTPDSEDLALMWNTLIGEDQIYYGWAGELNKAFRNCEKYNFAPICVDWCTEALYKPVSGNGPKGIALTQVLYEGNKVEALDPYNTIYDPRVPIHKVHERGEFAGDIKLMTRIELKMYLAGLGEDRLKNDREAFESPGWEVSYYTPHLNPDVILKNKNWSDGAFNWVNWAFGTAQEHIAYQNTYTVIRLYARIMPFEFGIRAPKDQTPDIWKLIAVNGVLVYAQPIPNAHPYLPVIILQSIVDGLDHQTKSPSENQLPFQTMVSALWNAKLNSARRRQTDRMLYNPLLVDPDHINSPNPAAKIPIRPTAYGRKLEEAVYVIPFNDENSQYWLQEAQGVGDWGMRANGDNKPTLGQFQKGNKLQDEWQQTMAAASNRQRSKALMIEAFGFQPLKVILKSNYLQFTPEGTKYNRDTQQNVNIDPIQLRKTAMEFEVGDGLLQIQRLMHVDVMQASFQALSSDPSIGKDYNKGDMFAYMMKMNGVDGLSQFKKPDWQIQYEQALQTWQTVAVEVAKSTKDSAEIMKAIGPMPTPQQYQQQSNQQPSNQQSGTKQTPQQPQPTQT